MPTSGWHGTTDSPPCAPTWRRCPATGPARSLGTRRQPDGPRASPSGATSSRVPAGCATLDSLRAGTAALPTAPAKPELATATGETVGLATRARGGARVGRGPGEGLLHREGRLQRRPRPSGQRRAALRAADPARVAHVHLARDRPHRHAARVPAGPADGGVGHRGRARRARRARRRRQRGPALPVGLVRVLQRSRRERLGGAEDPAPRLIPTGVSPPIS